MAQHDYVIANGTGAAVRSDLNNALAAIVSQNSGATEPATTYAFQFWADTTTSTLKLRNSANNAWIELMQLDGTLTMEDGTEALPGLSFRNDLDTGLWRPGANQLAISTNAVERVEFGASEVVFNDGGANYDFRVEGDTNANLLFVDASADAVGIGTSSPSASALLDVNGNARIGSAGNFDTDTRLLVASTGGNSFIQIQGADSTGTVGLKLGRNSVANSAGIDWSASTDKLTFRTNGTTAAMTIDSSQRVGIGTTSPGEMLTVGTSSAGGSLRLNSSSYGNNGMVRFYGTDGNEKMQISTGSSKGTIYTPSSIDLAFEVGNTEKARLDSSGRWLLGTSTTYQQFGSQDPHFVLYGTSDNTSGLTVHRKSNDSFTPRIHLSKSRTTDYGIVSNGDGVGTIFFNGADGSKTITAAQINGEIDGTPGTNDMPGRLVFSVTRDGASSPSEALRIKNTGMMDHTSNNPGNYALVTQNDGNNSDRYGLRILCGTYAATGTNYAVSIEDGDGNNQGYITFTSGTVTYGAFTAHHPCILPDADNEAGYPYGTLLEIINIEYTQKDGKDTERGILYNVRKTQAANSRAVLGAYGSSMNGGPGGETNRHQALVLGDGHILCNNSGGNIKVGDGICSSATPGIGQKATATPSMIIGIAQEDVAFADDDEVKLVAVQYGVRQFIPWGD